MEQDSETAGTGQDTTERDTIVSVADAAVLFGISTDAVRKRIRRGQLTAQKVGSQWFVVVDAPPVARRDRTTPAAVPRQDTPGARRGTGQDRTTARLPVVSEAARAQLEAIRDEWLAPMVDRIAEQAETIGRLTAERDALHARLSALEARQAESPAPHPDAPQTATDAATDTPWWQFWKW